MGTADHILEVLTLDVASFRAARGLMDRLEPVGLAERVRLVVNRATRAEITPRDVARVFGTEPLAVLPLDRSVPRAQDHGRLISPRGRTARTLDRLARRLLQDVPRS
jgi:Flp pilus assembly CpaE family ATPase